MPRVPLVLVGPVLVATLGDDLDDSDALDLVERVGQRVVADRASGVLLDISALQVVDSFVCKVLGDTATMVRVLGARVAVVGMRPAVAITLVELGIALEGVTTALTVDRGMRAVAPDAPDVPDAHGTPSPGRGRRGR